MWRTFGEKHGQAALKQAHEFAPQAQLLGFQFTSDGWQPVLSEMVASQPATPSSRINPAWAQIGLGLLGMATATGATVASGGAGAVVVWVIALDSADTMATGFYNLYYPDAPRDRALTTALKSVGFSDYGAAFTETFAIGAVSIGSAARTTGAAALAGNASKGMVQSAISRASVKGIAGTRGLQHSFDRHAAQWFSRHGGTPSIAKWQELLETASKSTKVVDWSTGADRTIGKLARIDGNKWFFVQFFKEGPRAGEIATAFIPNKDELRAILELIGK